MDDIIWANHMVWSISLDHIILAILDGNFSYNKDLFSTFKTKIITVTSQLNSTEDELNDCFHNSHKLELDQNKNVRQWSEQRKELNEKIEAARDQIGSASSCI